jgi:hypothetical protein
MVSFSPAMYFMVIHEKSIQFLRVGGRHIEIVFTVSNSDKESDELVSKFCENLKKTKTYYGQPFAVLIDNHDSFTYIKRYQSIQPTVLRDQLKLFQDSRTTLNFSTKESQHGSLVVIQGIDTEYLNQITSTLNKHECQVMFITTFSAYLAMNTNLANATNSSLSIIQWSQEEYTYFGSTAKGIVFSGTCEFGSNSSMDDTIQQIKSIFFPEIDNLKPTIYSQNQSKDSKTRSVSSLLNKGQVINQRQKALYKTTPTSRTALIFVTASNSMKLLFFVFLSLTLVSGISSLVSKPSLINNQTVTQYQDLYFQKTTLEHQIDSLNQIISTAKSPSRQKINPSTLFSIFCQNRYSGLSLNMITIKGFSKDSAVVEATGTSPNEANIFAYNQDLNKLSQPFPVIISSFRPEIVSINGQQDTVLSFKQSMVLYEKSANK